MESPFKILTILYSLGASAAFPLGIEHSACRNRRLSLMMAHRQEKNGPKHQKTHKTSMNILIFGNGPEEKRWAESILAREGDRLAGAFPGFEELPDLPGKKDLDEALTLNGVDAAIVGGDFELRAEGLRKVAAMGIPALVLHPPGENADPYYIVSMSKRETGALVVPCLAARLHPGIETLDEALGSNALGAFRELRLEIVENEEGLVERAFPRDRSDSSLARRGRSGHGDRRSARRGADREFAGPNTSVESALRGGSPAQGQS